MRQGILAFPFAVTYSFAVLTAPGAHAAILSFGNPTAFYGGTNCADVNGASLTPGTPVDARPCNGAQNEQFQWNSDNTIYALGAQRCLDMFGGVIAAGTKVDSYTCTGHDNQHWWYYNGQIKPLVSDTLCLDAGSGASGTQLILSVRPETY